MCRELGLVFCDVGDPCLEQLDPFSKGQFTMGGKSTYKYG